MPIGTLGGKETREVKGMEQVKAEINNSELDGMMKKQITIVVKMASFGSIDEVLKKFREIKKANPEEAFKMTIEIDLGDFSSLVLQHQLPSD